MNRLVKYFTEGTVASNVQTVGAEIETQFVDSKGNPVQTATSQKMLSLLVANGWKIADSKNGLITKLTDAAGNNIFYELGRHNIEVSTVAATPGTVISIAKNCLEQLYKVGQEFEAVPFFGPVLYGNSDLLVIPDDRDAIWVELDGCRALAPLARISAVQFTVSVNPARAIETINRLGENINLFLKDYPQDKIWRRYIKDSRAKYRTDRYGGPLLFEDMSDYCQRLSAHAVVQGTKLVPFSMVEELDIPLYLRSVWWYFRLKRYGKALCVEVRPMPRREDGMLQSQLEEVLDLI
ncbi:hypothetical protein KAZ57_00515 [Patescibacteria group bacterium]|nr:hypothetical protein [Patescibacteria group bacterium]